MKYPVLASFILFIVILQYNLRKSRNKSENSDKSFWEREREANFTRRKPLDDVIYISVPLDELPTTTMTDNDIVSDCIRQITELSKEKIINLTGLTNTDLKLKYGVANLPYLTSCDERYTALVQVLQKWADCLWENGCIKEAVTIMEYEMSIRADVGAAFRKLATYYRETNQSHRIGDLLSIAEGLQSASRDGIIRYLQEYYNTTGPSPTETT